MTQKRPLSRRHRNAKCSTNQLMSHVRRPSVSLPEYGPIPLAPGIQSFPTPYTLCSKGLDAVQAKATNPRTSNPIIAARYAAMATPFGIGASVGWAHFEHHDRPVVITGMIPWLNQID